MLGKLMKHELNATSRLLVPLYLVLLFISTINRFIFQTSFEGTIFKIFAGFLAATQVLIIVVILITTILFMITRFYKNLLSDEGYLMFTLPVNAHQLIVSKLVVAMFWTFVSIIVILSSLYIAFITSNNMSLVIAEIQNAFAELNVAFGGKWSLLLVELILLMLIGFVSNILMVYTSIAIGQLFSRHKIIASFVAYAVIYNAIQLVMIIVLVILSFILSGNIDFTNIIPQVFSVIILIALLTCIAFYTATNHIFEKKLNLD